EAETGKCLGSVFFPENEMFIDAPQSGWAEQDPEIWWENTIKAVNSCIRNNNIKAESIKAIGISYQMHGLVCIDKKHNVLRPSIIWCDSRAVETGNKAFKKIGQKKCLENLLNSPGNFTASKLKWLKENEADIYKSIHKILLPGDYIALKMTGKINTTISGLSEGIFWDFKNNSVANFLLDYYDIDKNLLAETYPSFAQHGKLNKEAATELGLLAGTPLTYRAGDQPNNAFSLNVLEPGEIAATAGTSGVVYGLSEEIKYDRLSRVNTFAHVNHSADNQRLGVLLCINGTGILNSWLRKNIGDKLSYNTMNNLASEVAIGSNGLVILPFGNGAERMLENKNIGSHILNLDFNIHSNKHLFRAAQEGIAFAFKYGMEIMSESGIIPETIRTGNTNMFQSKIFRETLAGITGVNIELYNTDGSIGAARGAGVGAGIYNSLSEAFENLKRIATIEPPTNTEEYELSYQQWKTQLNNLTT
ncbi:xylulokinase, partial [Bacteroidota bacterium]